MSKMSTKRTSSKLTVVVKLGTSVLTSGSSALDRAQMVELARQCAQLQAEGHKVVLVSSGAIAAGREHLNYPNLPSVMASKQLLAAVGQSRLMHIWGTLFDLYGIKIGQILLTRADLEDRERFLNARDTLQALLNHDIIPIINENDAVATSEIKVGDNDNLSVLAAILCMADHLFLLTDQDGLFTADPRIHEDAHLIKEVTLIDEQLRLLAGGPHTNLGTGGMATKLQAAEIAMRAGIVVTIARGNRSEIITKLVKGKREGTRFLPQEEALESRKRWILAGPLSHGELTIDEGAAYALLEKGSSLLAKGISRVGQQTFTRGDVVTIYNSLGEQIAKGISAYSKQDLEKIIGEHSTSIQSILGHDYGSEVVHRDDLVLL